MRVMRVLTRPNVGGPTMQAVALWHEHRKLGVRTVLAVGRCLAGETEVDLEANGIPRLDPSTVDAHSEGFVVVGSLGNRRSFIAQRRATSELLALMARMRPDVVHTHTSAAGHAGRRAAFASGVARTVHTFHGIVLRDYFGPLVSWALLRLEASLARRTSALVSVSPSCRDELASLGVAAQSRIRVVPPAVPTPLFVARDEARRRLGLPQDAFAVCAYGRLVPIKRPEQFVAALAKMPDAIGRMHGDGPLRARLEAAATHNVAIVPTHPDARACMTAYDALLLPSRREGLPLVAVEAFAAGVPVIGFDVPGVRDALTTWGSGLLVPESEGEVGLVAALRRLRTEQGLAAMLCAQAKAGLARFDPAAVAAELLDLYRSLPIGTGRA
jgi:glycosyltransferase involved in cell wall biosynthesis